MQGKALWSGVKNYVGALLTVVLFPILWVRSVRLARRHAEADPRGVLKVGAAIVLSVLLGVGGVIQFTGFTHSATNGMYKSLDRRVFTAVGESDFQDQATAIKGADTAIPIIQANIAVAEGNLANATAANASAPSAANAAAVKTAETKLQDLKDALAATQKGRADAVTKMAALQPNHALYGELAPAIVAHDDARIRELVAGAQVTLHADMAPNVEKALAIKDKAVHDMQNAMLYFVWPSLAGVFLAPVVFALGSILARAFVPSDTVGFKPYPGGAAGFFLLFGAFGVPAVPFAAWVFLDMEGRSREGQIAL